MRFTKTLLVTAFLAALPMMANAESQFSTTVAPNTAVARVDFQIVIPRFLYLRVGAGPVAPAYTPNDITINLVTFTVPAANVGSGTAVAGTGGDLGAGAVTARLIGNGGPITLNSLTSGALSNGLGDSISFAQITNAATVLTAAPLLAHPALVDGGTGTTIAVPVTSGTRVTNRDATWTFNYSNSNVVAAGSYGGVGVNNGRVTYTASML